MLSRDNLDVPEFQAILDDIVSDDRRAGAVISRVRALIRKEDLETPDTRYQPRLEIRASSGPSPADLAP